LQTVKSAVDFHRGKTFGLEFQPVFPGNAGVECLLPLRIAPAAGADM
jgi:hypothetical protein